MENSSTSNLLYDMVINEAMEGNYTTSMWESILDTIVSGLLRRKHAKDLPKEGRLSLCIIIVGAQHLHSYQSVLELLRDFDTGGPFWIIREELIRHYALKGVANLQPRRRFIQQLKQELRLLFEEYGNESYLSISNVSFVQPRIEKLKEELNQLVETISSPDTYPIQDVIEEYRSNYSSQSFSDWFIKWGQKKLREYRMVARENICNGHLKKENLFQSEEKPIQSEQKSIDNTTTNRVERDSDLKIFEMIPEANNIPKDGAQENKNDTPLSESKKKRNTKVDSYKRKKVKKTTEKPLQQGKDQTNEINSLLDGEDKPSQTQLRSESECGILKDFGKEIWHIFSPLEF